MSSLDKTALAREFVDAYANKQIIATPPTGRESAFDVAAAYEVEAELVRLRLAEGRTVVGRKVGYANKAMWRVLGLETLVWGHMYDDTVRHAERNAALLPVGRMTAPKIEPEVVFKLRAPLGAGPHTPAEALAAVEWLALGFEVVDNVYGEAKFQPADFIASYAFHAALVIGEPRRIDTEAIPAFVDQLARCTARLQRNGEVMGEGGGRNVLRSPALCLAELAAAATRAGEPLAAGEIVSTGALVDSKPMAPGEEWRASLEGIELPELIIRTTE